VSRVLLRFTAEKIYEVDPNDPNSYDVLAGLFSEHIYHLATDEKYEGDYKLECEKLPDEPPVEKSEDKKEQGPGDNYDTLSV